MRSGYAAPAFPVSGNRGGRQHINLVRWINSKKILTYVNNDCIVNDISQKQCGNGSG